MFNNQSTVQSLRIIAESNPLFLTKGIHVQASPSTYSSVRGLTFIYKSIYSLFNERVCTLRSSHRLSEWDYHVQSISVIAFKWFSKSNQSNQENILNIHLKHPTQGVSRDQSRSRSLIYSKWKVKCEKQSNSRPSEMGLSISA